MDARDLTPAIGAEVLDVDVRQEISGADAERLRQLFADRHLLLFRGRELSTEDQVRVAALFGPIDANPDGTLTSRVANTATGGTSDFVSEARLLFHSDLEYTDSPLIGISLYGEVVGETSAPTTFANAARALQNLPEDVRRRIDGRSLMHIADLRAALHRREVDGDGYRVRLADIGVDASFADFPRSIHPLVYVYDEQRSPVLFVSENQGSHVIDLTDEESEVLIAELFGYLYATDNLYTHHWQLHDLVVWDNVALQHSRPATVGPPRTLRRVAINDEPHRQVIQRAMAGLCV